MKKPILIGFSTIVLICLYLPILILILFSFNKSKINAQWSGFTFDWYLNLFKNPQVVDALMNSLTIAIITTILSTILGTICALALHKHKYKFSSFISGLVYLPIVVPDILMGLSLLILFTNFHIELGSITIIIAHVTFCISYVIILLAARLSGMSSDLEDAASDLGATPWQTFRFVTLPALMPGIIASALLCFTLSIDDFVISFFVSGPSSTTLPIYIYGMVKKGVTPEINAISTILIVTIIFLMVVSEVYRTKGINNKTEKKSYIV
ncbi:MULTISPECIES: ABC transporter permease [unclassified Bacillus (in: firmicutes)]|uniref:ABC transporter permease n=1 Tax=unclassified Bacillus (in: firmicutes) TaxID=185979 RepID=UPI000BF10D30|nr:MULTISPECIES: ABC transporter permease [unclassified Bacillus (in: firmicutes)]PEJ56262.1 spermidine/putrescine ABC transporter permease [Bacillus sp. AFS002410]PEL10526.1 spermidine/putrescine ABC transporter permease [Bacillus sp. AFS017336]